MGERAMEASRREAERPFHQRYANSAVRRVSSVNERREAVVKEVLSDLQTLQSERRQAGEQKGLELQRRCEESDWRHCKSVVTAKRKETSRGPRVSAESTTTSPAAAT